LLIVDDLRREGEMADKYRITRRLRLANLLVSALIRLGIGPRSSYLLTTVGRKTGRSRTTPVGLIETEEGRWLVAPYGPVGWVHNVRAAHQALLGRGRRRQRVSVRELAAQQAAPVLHTYVTDVPIVRPYFDVTPDSPIEDFVAEAPRHPVFQLQ
jgi:deazaflavin-dependent oxidoreductase (nitroreductase family)